MIVLCTGCRSGFGLLIAVTAARAGHTVAANWSGKVKALVQGVTAMVIVGEPVYRPLLGSRLTSLGAWVVIVVTLASAAEYVKQAVVVSLNSAASK